MATECVTNHFETVIVRFFRNDYDELEHSWVSNKCALVSWKLDIITGIVVWLRAGV
jgi:hypothetical protein